eukprot:TRINITY_DN7330_c0_g1_i2.p1 TRINITY_DN7330_c0_g1~~TRINITY_DN7330_c0_g1_i2.p1  ORF type:complete len:601 (-),score=101.33 TRINITY_DN7330_c0_g1_i2:148-1950(-)
MDGGLPGRIARMPAGAAAAIRGAAVVPSPARAVEELVLNALDAGASRVEVMLHPASQRRCAADVGASIEVSDNGRGIAAGSFSALAESGGTSRPEAASVTSAVGGWRTYGLRGEALYALRAVAGCLAISSKAAGDPTAETWTKEFRAGAVRACGPARSCPRGTGTTVRVEGLLAALPVRQRYLANDAAAWVVAAKRCLERIALMHPRVRFHFEEVGVGVAAKASAIASSASHGDCTRAACGRTSLELPPAGSLTARLAQVLGPGCPRKFVELPDPHSDRGDENWSCRLEGAITLPGEDVQATDRFVFIFVNGRCVERTRIHHLVGEIYGYCACILAGRHFERAGPVSIAAAAGGASWPAMILDLRCSSESYDIGYEPDRTTVQFHDWRMPLRCVRSALRRVLLARSPLFEAAFRNTSSAHAAVPQFIGFPAPGCTGVADAPDSATRHDDNDSEVAGMLQDRRSASGRRADDEAQHDHGASSTGALAQSIRRCSRNSRAATSRSGDAIFAESSGNVRVAPRLLQQRLQRLRGCESGTHVAGSSSTPLSHSQSKTMSLLRYRGGAPLMKRLQQAAASTSSADAERERSRTPARSLRRLRRQW